MKERKERWKEGKKRGREKTDRKRGRGRKNEKKVRREEKSFFFFLAWLTFVSIEDLFKMKSQLLSEYYVWDVLLPSVNQCVPSSIIPLLNYDYLLLHYKQPPILEFCVDWAQFNILISCSHGCMAKRGWVGFSEGS